MDVEMLFTATTILIVYLLAAAFIIGGFATKNAGIAFFGIALLFLGGYVLFTQGIAEKTGETLATNVTSNVTTTTYVYDENRGTFTNGLGMISFFIGAGLAFYMIDLYRDGKRRRDSGEED